VLFQRVGVIDVHCNQIGRCDERHIVQAVRVANIRSRQDMDLCQRNRVKRNGCGLHRR